MTAAKIIDIHGRPFNAQYDAAKHTRRTAGWNAFSTGVNTEISNDLETLRNRHRDLVRNNPWARRAVQAITTNTIGAGIHAQWHDQERQNRWVNWFESTECDADGRNNGYGLQSLVMRSIVESGECLIRFRTRRPEDNLTIPLQIQVLESDYLDHQKTQSLPNGGWITQGVEFSPIGQRIAYWLFNDHPCDPTRNVVLNSERRSIDGILHLYRVDRPGQVRGVPWGTGSMLRLKMLDDWHDAQLEACRLTACMMGFRRFSDQQLFDDSEAQIKTEYQLYEKFEPGAIEDLPPGVDMQFNTPLQPSNNENFTDAMHYAIASDYGITFESLTGNMSKVNFSSGRMGRLEFERNIDVWRWQLLAPQFLQPLAKWFLLAETIVYPNSTASEQPLWSAPARTLVDPAREVPPIKEMVKAGLLSLPEAIRKQGYDPIVLANEHAEYLRYLSELGINTDTVIKDNVNRNSN
ncbi:phage portal protein [Rhodoferax sp. 4810]|nr:phage portal protein [Rhodoferax jenense]